MILIITTVTLLLILLLVIAGCRGRNTNESGTGTQNASYEYATVRDAQSILGKTIGSDYSFITKAEAVALGADASKLSAYGNNDYIATGDIASAAVYVFNISSTSVSTYLAGSTAYITVTSTLNGASQDWSVSSAASFGTAAKASQTSLTFAGGRSTSTASSSFKITQVSSGTTITVNVSRVKGACSITLYTYHTDDKYEIEASATQTVESDIAVYTTGITLTIASGSSKSSRRTISSPVTISSVSPVSDSYWNYSK
jgi:hypothetical protein